MSKATLILAGLLVALAVGVVASASAEPPPPPTSCMKVTTAPAYCIEGVALVSASEKIEGTNNGESLLKGTIASVTAEIKCEKGKSTGSIEGGAAGTVGKSTTKTKLEKCKLLKPANCKLTPENETEIPTTELKGELKLTSGRIEEKLQPREGAFATVSIEGSNSSCVIAQPEVPKGFNITGSQICEVDSSNAVAETEAEKHKLICKTSGSNLSIGTNPAEMEDEQTVKLTSSKKWSVKET